jgi:hypothetical protein
VVCRLIQHITTGPHPGHPGACIAHYNHATLSQLTHHSSNHSHNHNHIYFNPYIQQPISGLSPYGVSPWVSPGSLNPFLY